MVTFIIYFLNLTVLSALVVAAYQFIDVKLIKAVFFPALVIKLISGGVLGLLFYNYYEIGDTIVYYEQAQEISNSEWQFFWERIFQNTLSSQPVRAIYFTRILAILLFFTKANYWLATLYFSFFSFFGTLYFVRQLSNWRPGLTLAGIVAFMFFPSVVFWSSGILKESLTFGSMLILCGGYIKYKRLGRLSWIDLLLTIISLAVLTILKYYIAAVLIPMLIYVLVFDELERRQIIRVNLWLKSALILIVLTTPAYLFFSWISPNLSLEHFSTIVSQSHDSMLANSHFKNAIPAIHWFDNSMDIIVNIVYYIISGIFRPILPEDLNFPGVLSSVENMTILVLVVWKLVKIKRVNMQPEHIALFLYIVTTCVFLAYTIPNLGALSRFKVYYMPFVLLMILIDHPVTDKFAKIKFLQ